MESWQTGLNKPRVEETTLKAVELQVERKSFNLMLKENPRGQFVRITEVGPHKSNSIIIPASGLEEFCSVFSGLGQSAEIRS